MDAFFYPVIIASLISGASIGLLGVYVVGMRIAFIGTCISHAAMAGAVLGTLWGLNSAWCAIALSILAALSLAMIRPDRIRLETNVALAIVFSLMMGLTFLGVGLLRNSRSDVLAMLWGSVLFVNIHTMMLVILTAVVLTAFVIACDKELRAILFSRSIAAAMGIHEQWVYIGFLILSAVTLTINIPAVGGLLIFSLLTNPAAAAYQLCRGYKAVVLTATALGAATAVIGFWISFLLDLPTGACIVLISVAFFAVSVLIKCFIKGID
jgi:manganese/iron transport system permease protein